VPRLPAGACPLYLPVVVKDRCQVLVRLQRQRVGTFVFGLFAHPAMDVAAFPEAATLRDDVLCLPIHHDLDGRDLERVAELLG
jgi:dTDP-4-amino-4,6-dideoxygalactose transaminase